MTIKQHYQAKLAAIPSPRVAVLSELAGVAGVSVHTVWHWIKGDKKPSRKRLQALADYLGEDDPGALLA